MSNSTKRNKKSTPLVTSSLPAVVRSQADDDESVSSDEVDAAMGMFDMNSFIASLKEMGKQNAKKKRSGANVNRLRELAIHLKITKSQKKYALIEAIFSRLEKNDQLANIQAMEKEMDFYGKPDEVESELSEEDDSMPTFYRKDKHTLPRIVNIILSYASELVNIEQLATRNQLQQREIYGTNPLFAKVARDFNNPSHNSGGLAADHEVLEEHNIDPEEIDTTCKITAKQVYKYFRRVLIAYKAICPNYMSSGIHTGADFWGFAKNAKKCSSVDLLYFHLAVMATKCNMILQFASGGVVIPNGVDTASKQPQDGTPCSELTIEDGGGGGRSIASSSYEVKREKKRSRDESHIVDLTKAINEKNDAEIAISKEVARSAVKQSNITSLSSLENLIRETRSTIDREKDRGENADKDEIARLEYNLILLRAQSKHLVQTLNNDLA